MKLSKNIYTCLGVIIPRLLVCLLSAAFAQSHALAFGGGLGFYAGFVVLFVIDIVIFFLPN